MKKKSYIGMIVSVFIMISVTSFAKVPIEIRQVFVSKYRSEPVAYANVAYSGEVYLYFVRPEDRQLTPALYRSIDGEEWEELQPYTVSHLQAYYYSAQWQDLLINNLLWVLRFTDRKSVE